MQKRHKNKEQYFNEQGLTSKTFVLPFISDLVNFGVGTSVLEIGCAEAGNLKPFVDMGCKATGIDISCNRIDLAKTYYEDHPNNKNLTLICQDIYKVNPDKKYDVIIMRDVIEHIPNQEIFLGFVKSFLKAVASSSSLFHLGKILLAVISKYAGVNYFRSFPGFTYCQDLYIG